MRAADRDEIAAHRGFHHPGKLAADALSCAPHAWSFRHDGEAAAVIGHHAGHNGANRTVFMFATDALPKVGLRLHAFTVREMAPGLALMGCSRVSCWSLENHKDAHRWLRRLGGRVQARAPGFGSRGETFLLFARELYVQPKPS
jgi:hypothetical protein